MNFGTVGSGTENEGIFALENQNPINIELHGWGVNMPGAVLELMGCQNSPTDMFNKGYRNITACSITGNVNFIDLYFIYQDNCCFNSIIFQIISCFSKA